MFEYRREQHGTVTILSLRGNLDALSAHELRREIDALVTERRSPVIVDLAGLELIDSSGVGSIISLLKRMRLLSPPGEVKIAELRGQPQQIFQLLRLNRAFDMCTTVAEPSSELT